MWQHVRPKELVMTAKTKAALAWTPLIGIWVWDIFSIDGRLFKALFACIVVVILCAYWMASRSDPETEPGLQKISNVFLGFLCFQIAVMLFIAFHAAGTK
jgi:hypothetical protein